jgi:hypothetical protein
MKEERIYELIYKITSGEANAAERKEVEELIANDSAARKLYDSEVKLETLLQSAGTVKPEEAPDLSPEVMKNIEITKYSIKPPIAISDSISLKHFWQYVKYGLTFVGGAAASVLLYVMLNTTATKDLSSSSFGSLADAECFSKAEQVIDVPIELQSGNSRLTIKLQEEKALLKLETNLNKPLVYIITFISADLQTLGVFPEISSSDCTYKASSNYVEISTNGTNTFSIPFKATQTGSKFISFQALEDGKTTFEKNFTVYFN